MDCRETPLLTAFHDGEMPAADRAKVEEHLRGCPECAARLADLARVDRAAGVPDPGPAYWDRFNARVMERVEREADGPKVTVLRPKDGWVRQQLRYLVPAAAAVALVVGIVRYSGTRPDSPGPTVPPVVSVPAAPDPAGERMAKGEPASRATKKAEGTAVPRRAPPPILADEQFAAATREEQDRPGDRSVSPQATYRGTPPGSQPVPAPDGMAAGMQAERKKMAEATAPITEQQAAARARSGSGVGIAKVTSSGSPCELARTLAERKRFREAEDAQRACLAEDLPEPYREKGLVFLAELLDRQGRVSEADAVIAEIRRQFPESLPLDLYLRRRPAAQKRQE